MNKDLKKKILLGIIVVILLGGIIFASYKLTQPNSYENGSITAVNNTSANSSDSKSEGITSSSTSVTDTESGVDWSKADTYEITTESGDVNITKGGVYTVSGTLKGTIYVKTDADVKIILDSANITSNGKPAIYVENADNVYIEVKGESTITTTTNSTLDAAIYSKDDLYLYGSGTLTINSNYDGITSKDDLVISSGTYIITASADGIKGKDSITIEDGTYTINAGEDAIKTTNEEEKGEMVINGGTFNLTSELDGIQAESTLTINGGSFKVKTTGTSSSESHKGLKAETNIEINGGTFNIDATDDGIHSNGNITINKGEFTIDSDDDGVHADGMIEINGGTLTITAHEGIEATYVKINDGTIKITASDDGINAGNKSNAYAVTIEINGGNITINMGQGDTDGIDSNGNLYINGGTINITGNSPFDYDGEAKYSGGTIIVNGETTNTITNQFGGNMGGGPMGGMNNGGMQGNGGMMRGRR